MCGERILTADELVVYEDLMSLLSNLKAVLGVLIAASCPTFEGPLMSSNSKPYPGCCSWRMPITFSCGWSSLANVFRLSIVVSYNGYDGASHVVC